jgi:Spy/CpxP family protein refolding chaperone
MNTRRLIASLALVSVSVLSTAAFAEEVSGLNSGDPVSVSPRSEPSTQVKKTAASDAQRDAIRAEGRAAMLKEYHNTAYIAELDFGSTAAQPTYKTEAAPSTEVAQQGR